MKSSLPFLVCFGDSLTSGFQTGSEVFATEVDAPYGGFIQQWVGAEANIVVTGICGELTREMVQRFRRDVLDAQPKMTVILGGTNDLGSGVLPTHICANLQQMYRLALDAGVQPIGVTVPSICLDDASTVSETTVSDSKRIIPAWVQTHIDQRLELNRQIVEVSEGLDLTCLDLFSETSEANSLLLASRFSSDGLHLNTAGYEMFARLVWRHLLADTFGECPSRL
jgi:acyl-CoA thioesterase-1